MGPIGRLAVIAAALVLAACGAVAHHRVTELPRIAPNPSIVLMPLDVELSEMTVGGLLEPKAEWTHAAADLLVSGLREEKQRRGFRLVELSAAFEPTPAESELIDQLNRLHGAVGRTLMDERYISLPNKRGVFDWSLGPDVRMLRERTGADYALFVFMRDSYASEGRKLAMVAAAAMGVVMWGGAQVGFASLVDLRTGDLVWFNHLARNSGDLRTRDKAGETIKALLTEFPK
jgi:hypothetical protein